MNAHVAQLRDRRAVYPFDMLRDLAADASLVVEHDFREHH